MIKKYETVDKIIYLIRNILEENLPIQGSIKLMDRKSKELLQKFINNEEI